MWRHNRRVIYIYKCTNISFSTYIYIIFRRDLSLARRCCYCFDFQFFPWNQISRNFEIIFNPELGVEWILSNCSFLMPHLQQKQLKIQFLHQCWRVDLDPHCCVRKKNGKTIQKHNLLQVQKSRKNYVTSAILLCNSNCPTWWETIYNLSKYAISF